jgi:hypothetical protein
MVPALERQASALAGDEVLTADAVLSPAEPSSPSWRRRYAEVSR